MSRALNKYITSFDYAGKTLLVSLAASSGVYLCSFTTVIGIPVGITRASISLVFLISNGIVRMFLKTMVRKKLSKERLLHQVELS